VRHLLGHIGFPMNPESILVWNVGGLNGRLHHDALREMVAEEHPSIVCVQDTKLVVISDFDVTHYLGPDLTTSFSCLFRQEAAFSWHGVVICGRSHTLLVPYWSQLGCNQWVGENTRHGVVIRGRSHTLLLVSYQSQLGCNQWVGANTSGLPLSMAPPTITSSRHSLRNCESYVKSTLELGS
jgi:hypothetical protein